MYRKNAFRIRERKTGKMFDCFVQCVDLNFNGHYVMRYNIGINRHCEWSFVCAVYDNDKFNAEYEVIE